MGLCLLTRHVWGRRGSPASAGDAEADRIDQASRRAALLPAGLSVPVDGEDIEVEITQESLQAFLDENAELRHRLEAEGKWPRKR